MRRLLLVTTIAVAVFAGQSRVPAASAPSHAADEEELLRRATLVFTRAASGAAAAIPASVLMTAAGIAVFPSAVRNGERYYGTGVMSARGARGDVWTPPAILAFEGQLPLDLETGTADFVIVAQTRRGLDDLTLHRFAAMRPLEAGVLDRTAIRLGADLLAYLQFDRYLAGVAIADCVIREVPESNAALYGHPYSTEDIVRGAGFFRVPPAGRGWRQALADYFRQMS